MAKKKKTSSAKVQKVKVERVEQKTSMLESFIPKDQNAIISMAIVLIIGLIVGMLITFGAFSVAPVAENNNQTLSIDVNALTLKVEDYLNNNLVVDESVIAKIGEVDEIDLGIYRLYFTVKEDDALVGDGFVYATNKSLFLGQMFNMNEPLEIPETNESEQQVETQKADVPDAELYIWSYCPYGVTALAPFSEVAKTIGNETQMSVILYYAGHGEYELQQNKIQACIQEIDKGKYWDYAETFVDQIYPKCGSTKDKACDLEESINLMDSLNINSKNVLDCVELKGDELLKEHSEKAKAMNVTGSPSLVVNGVKLNNFNRTADGMLSVICNTFNEAPQACLAQLGDDLVVSGGAC